MRLSEAILAGIGGTEQGREIFLRIDAQSQEVVECCALGAAALGAGYDPFQEGLSCGMFLDSKFPELWVTYNSPKPGALFNEITERNDSGESRESIAADLARRGL